MLASHSTAHIERAFSAEKATTTALNTSTTNDRLERRHMLRSVLRNNQFVALGLFRQFYDLRTETLFGLPQAYYDALLQQL